MSVLRFLRVRVARLLMRLARKLDSAGLTTSPLPGAEQFDALRMRYPGAPDHWLQLVAKRAPIPLSVPSRPGEIPSDRTSAEIDSGPYHEEQAEPRDFDFSTSRKGAPVIFRGSQQPSRARPTVGFLSPNNQPAPTQPMGIGHAPQRTRNAEVRGRDFFRPLRRVSARLVSTGPSALRQRAKRNSLKFNRGTDLRRRTAAEYQLPPATTHDRPDPSSFGELRYGHSRGLDWEPDFNTQAVQDKQLSDPRFGSVRPRRLIEPSWISGDPAQIFHPAEFRASKNEWPDLPSVDDDHGAAPYDRSEEGALGVEQMSGRWSA